MSYSDEAGSTFFKYTRMNVYGVVDGLVHSIRRVNSLTESVSCACTCAPSFWWKVRDCEHLLRPGTEAVTCFLCLQGLER